MSARTITTKPRVAGVGRTERMIVPRAILTLARGLVDRRR